MKGRREFLNSLSLGIPLGASEMLLINSVVIVFRAVILLDRTQWIFLSAEELGGAKTFRLHYLQEPCLFYSNLTLALNLHILPPTFVSAFCSQEFHLLIICIF